MVAVVGAPAVGELGHVLGADVDAAVGKAVGDVHEDLGALARLRVFVNHVAVLGVVVNVLEVLHDALADVDDAHRRAELLGDDDRVRLRAVGRAEAGHGHGGDGVLRQTHHLRGLGADDDGERGVHAAGDADDGVLQTGVLHAAHEGAGLHVQQALCRRVIVLLVRGTVGILAERAGERRVGELLAPAELGVFAGAALEVLRLAAGGDHQLDVKLGGDVGAALFLAGEDAAELRHGAEAGVGGVGAALAEAGGGHHVARHQAAALLLDGGGHHAGGVHAHLETAQLRDHARAGEGVLCGGSHGGVRVRADLRRDLQVGHHVGVKQQLRAEEHRLVEEVQLRHAVAAGGEVLVAHVLGGDEAEHAAVGDRGGAVIDLRALLDGQADEDQHIHAGGGVRHLLERGERAAQQRVLVEQIAAGRARETQLREHEDLHALLVGLFHDLDDLLCVVHGVGGTQHRRCSRDFQESVFHKAFTLFYLDSSN